jgi:hypothetical protein
VLLRIVGFEEYFGSGGNYLLLLFSVDKIIKNGISRVCRRKES